MNLYICIAGIVGINDSLFTYSIGESWETYHDDNFSPSYELVFVNPSLESRAMNVCDDDQFCLYDIATTGRLEIGMSTLDGSRSFNEIVQLSYASKQDNMCWLHTCAWIMFVSPVAIDGIRFIYTFYVQIQKQVLLVRNRAHPMSFMHIKFV